VGEGIRSSVSKLEPAFLIVTQSRASKSSDARSPPRIQPSPCYPLGTPGSTPSVPRFRILSSLGAATSGSPTTFGFLEQRRANRSRRGPNLPTPNPIFFPGTGICSQSQPPNHTIMELDVVPYQQTSLQGMVASAACKSLSVRRSRSAVAPCCSEHGWGLEGHSSQSSLSNIHTKPFASDPDTSALSCIHLRGGIWGMVDK
jgi:hypothetical protein